VPEGEAGTFRVVAAETFRAVVVAVHEGFRAAVARASPDGVEGVRAGSPAAADEGFLEARAFPEAAAGSPAEAARVFQAAEAIPAETAVTRAGNVSREAGAALTGADAEAIIAAEDITAAAMAAITEAATTAATTAVTIPVTATGSATTGEPIAILTATTTSGAHGIPIRTAASIPTTMAATTVTKIPRRSSEGKVQLGWAWILKRSAPIPVASVQPGKTAIIAALIAKARRRPQT